MLPCFTFAVSCARKEVVCEKDYCAALYVYSRTYGTRDARAIIAVAIFAAAVGVNAEPDANLSRTELIAALASIAGDVYERLTQKRRQSRSARSSLSHVTDGAHPSCKSTAEICLQMATVTAPS